LSLNPCSLPRWFFALTPAMENGWHGNPPTSMSWSGISFSSIFVMSPCGTSPKFASYVCCENLFHSDENRHFPPDDSNACRRPPIPANRSINVKFSFFVNTHAMLEGCYFFFFQKQSTNDQHYRP